MKRLGLVTLVLVSALVAVAPATPQEKGSEVWEFTPPEHGMELSAFLTMITEETGQSIVYNAQDPAVKAGRVFFTGTHRVPRERIFDWCQSVLSYHRLVLVPMGPEGHRQWAVLNVNDPAVANYPTYVEQSELHRWKDRDGVYVMTVLTCKHLQDTTRARNALANLITRPSGRINDVPGTRSFVIGDFAPVVYRMSQLVAEMDRPGTAYGVPTIRSGPTGKAAPKRDPLERYEEMLRDCETTEAARYFLERIEEILEEREGD